jgi:hypothetical protein
MLAPSPPLTAAHKVRSYESAFAPRRPQEDGGSAIEMVARCGAWQIRMLGGLVL